jgi:hypothetical protein
MAAAPGNFHNYTPETLKTTKTEFVSQLRDSMGYITKVCRTLNVSINTYYGWIKDDPEFATKVKEVEEGVVDRVIAELLVCGIKEHNVTAMIYFLNKKGYIRGLGEKGGRNKISGKMKKYRTAEELVEAQDWILENMQDAIITHDDAMNYSAVIENKRKAIETNDNARDLLAIKQHLGIK